MEASYQTVIAGVGLSLLAWIGCFSNGVPTLILPDADPHDTTGIPSGITAFAFAILASHSCASIVVLCLESRPVSRERADSEAVLGASSLSDSAQSGLFCCKLEVRKPISGPGVCGCHLRHQYRLDCCVVGDFVPRLAGIFVWHEPVLPRYAICMASLVRLSLPRRAAVRIGAP